MCCSHVFSISTKTVLILSLLRGVYTTLSESDFETIPVDYYIDKLFDTYKDTSVDLLTKVGMINIYKDLNLSILEKHHDPHEDHFSKKLDAAVGKEEEGLPHCIALEDIYLFNYDVDEIITKETFQDFYVPMLFDMVISAECFNEEEETDHDHGIESGEKTTAEWKKWVFTLLAVIVMQLLATLVILLYPVIAWNSNVTKWMFLGLTACGLGALVGDAVLHLIPGGLNLHFHSAEEESQEGHDHADESGATLTTNVQVITRLLLLMLGAYFMYAFESALEYFGHSHHADHHGFSHGPSHTHSHDHHTHNNTHDHAHKQDEAELEKQGHAHHRDAAALGGIKGYFADLFKRAEKTVWVLLFGDMIHALVDGIAIGVSFNMGLSYGMTTSFAVLFHEIPHKLTDFAIVLNAGMTKYEATAFSFISGMSGIVGGVVGMAVGDSFRVWLLLFTAGVFLYISLVDILPHLSDPNINPHGHRLANEIIKHLGIYTGVGFMVIVALYIENIEF